MASALLHNPLTRLVGNLLTGVNAILQFFLFMGLIFVSLGLLRPSGRLGNIFFYTLGEIAPPYVNETIQPGLLPREVLAIIVQVAIIMGAMILSASLAMYFRVRQSEAKAREQSSLVGAMGGEHDVTIIDRPEPPTFEKLLLRNTLMTVIFVPMPMLVFWGAVNFTVFDLEKLLLAQALFNDRTLLEIVTRLGLFAAFGLIAAWFAITHRIVDRGILKMPTPKRLWDDLGDDGSDGSFVKWIIRRARFLGGLLFSFVKTITPVLFLMLGLTVLVDVFNLPDIVYYFGLLLGLGGMMYWHMTVGLERSGKKLTRQIEAILVEEHGADSDEVREFQQAEKGHDNSTESHSTRFFLKAMFIMFGLVFAGAFIAAEVTTASGGSLDDRKSAATLALVIGIIGLFVGMFLLSRFTPQSPGLKLIDQATAAYGRLDYPEMLRVTEQLLIDVPNWESKSWAANAYLVVRRFDDSERCIHEVLDSIARMPDDKRQAMKGIAATMRGVLANLHAAQARYVEAEDSVRAAITLEPGEPAHYNVLAEILMLQGRPIGES